jgi:aldose 1-epimerase
MKKMTRKNFLTTLACTVLTLLPLSSYANESKNAMNIAKSSFGKNAKGEAVTLYTLTNSQGNTVKMIDYGAIVVSIDVPDKTGTRANVNAGFSNMDGYLMSHPYFGATVGRYCNRIAKGKFTIDGKEYSLATNNGPNHLHGGKVGFDKLMWKVTELTTPSSVGLRLNLTSPDGDEGYPGALKVTADYVWDNDNKLSIRFQATSDKATHVNLTNHAYFHLGGIGSGTVYDHALELACTQYLPIDDNMIPTGKTASVTGTGLDFTKSTSIGQRIAQFTATKGYDHCYVVDGSPGTLRKAANVVEPKSGRTMTVFTTQPGIQLYTGNFLDNSEANAKLGQHGAFCLETQHYPDSPNQPNFPSTLLKPGQTLDQTTTYQFGVQK